MKIAIEGCSHGELDHIYDSIKKLEEMNNIKVDLLIICGDFQAVRNPADLWTMAVKDKYCVMNTFYKYYSGEKKAPMLTIFIGGNHEASNHMTELFYGGWVAPNIYYLGSAGVIKVGELRIAGLSGIYNGGHYLKGHFEFFPFNESTKRSVYHVRNLEVFRLKQLNEPVDIMLTHDWPRGIYNYGDVQNLLRHKGFFQKEIEENTLGSRPAEDLLKKLKPAYWFSAHLHCKFAALVKHDSENATKFLALDKCLPRRNFLQILDIPKMTSTTLQYDPEWLSILKQTDHLLNIERCNTFMPGPGCNDRWDFTSTKEELEEINKLFSNNFKIPENFEATVEFYTPEKSFNDFKYTASVSSQTTKFCNKLNIVDPLALLLKGAKTSCPNFDIVEEKETDVTNVSQLTYNPDEISIMSNEDQDHNEDFDVSFVIDKVGNRPIETSSNISQDNPSSSKRSLEESPCTTDRVMKRRNINIYKQDDDD